MNNTQHKKIVSEQSKLWGRICNKYATNKDIARFLANYEKSSHYKALEPYEHKDYIEFKRLIKDALNKYGFLIPPELVYITVENYLQDYIRYEIDIYS